MTDGPRLRVVADPNEPWQKRPDEEEPEYGLFLMWLIGDKPRPVPDFPQIALKNDWADRANAYDATVSLPTAPKALFNRMMQDALTLGAIETRKLLERSRADRGSTLDVRELIAHLAFLAGKPSQVAAALEEETDSADTSELTEEECRSILEAKRILAKVKK